MDTIAACGQQRNLRKMKIHTRKEQERKTAFWRFLPPPILLQGGLLSATPATLHPCSYKAASRILLRLSGFSNIDIFTGCFHLGSTSNFIARPSIIQGFLIHHCIQKQFQCSS